MKKRRTSSHNGGIYIYPTVFSLFFIAAFGSLFYFLYEQSIELERQKVERNVQELSSVIHTILFGNERAMLLGLSDSREMGEGLKHEYRRHLALHPEIICIEATSPNGHVEWSIAQDSSSDILPAIVVRDKSLSFSDDSSSLILYSKLFQYDKGYFFIVRFLAGGRNGSMLSFSVLCSAEKLLGAVLTHHSVESYEISLFSGAGQSVASTGFSNAPATFRVQRAVDGYDRLMSVDVADPKFSFWTVEMAFLALFCTVLIVLVFVITLGLQRDVERLKAADSSLRSSEERFRAIFENSADAMRLMDRYGRSVMVNSAYCDMVKNSYEELLREYNSGDENLEQRYSANSAFRNQFDAGTLKMPTSQAIKRRDGVEIPVEASHSFIDVGKNEKLLMSIFRDVSQRKKYELESQQIQRMDALGAFAVGIGNNLKNIVGIVTNSAEVIEKNSHSNPLLTQYVEMIIRESKRASELADDLLVFARSKSSEQKPIPVEKILNQVKKILEHSLPAHIRLSVFMNDNLAVLNGDIHQLHQAVVNLALAAEHRMPKGGEIKIETAIAGADVVKQHLPSQEGKEFAEIKVFDNGKELDEYNRRRVFEPFFSSRTSDQGTGLRLSVVYGIAQQHGGFVTVQSEQGKGTTFSLFFPILYHEKEKGELPIPETPQGGSECILIADDEDSFRQIYEHGLVSFGYKVYAAQDGERALALYQDHSSEIGLVVTDLMMPNMSGEELFHKLKTLNPSVRVILATGAIDLKAKTEFLKMGVRDIIEKPFLLDELMIAVRKALDAS